MVIQKAGTKQFVAGAAEGTLTGFSVFLLFDSKIGVPQILEHHTVVVNPMQLDCQDGTPRRKTS